MPPTTLMTSTQTTRISVLTSAPMKVGVGEKVEVVLQADEADVVGVEQIVMQRREIQRHRQRHDHPQEQQDDRRRDQEAARGCGLLRRHGSGSSQASRSTAARACAARSRRDRRQLDRDRQLAPSTRAGDEAPSPLRGGARGGRTPREVEAGGLRAAAIARLLDVAGLLHRGFGARLRLGERVARRSSCPPGPPRSPDRLRWRCPANSGMATNWTPT